MDQDRALEGAAHVAPHESASGQSCGTCGALNPVGQKFCGDCGSPLARGCPSCGAAHVPGQKFCGECGAAIPVAGRATPASGVPRAAPAPAVPGAVRGLPAGASSATAERRLVSVLFADLVGFTPFAEERDAEDVRDTLTRYFDLATDVITSHGGVVEKFIGDAVMAVWGTPTAREDDAERAVRAALELVGQVRSLGGEIQARAAVLTGEAAVTIGATNQGMVAGDLVNTAARLQGVAQPGTVLVGEATQRLASGSIMFEAIGEQSLKGKIAPVPAWRAVRVVAERGGRRRADALEAPFAGRDDDLRLLKDMYSATTRERRVRLVSVTGVAGSGKSRIAWEFEKYIDGIVGTTWWHHGRSPAYGEGITFWALGEMVRQRARLAETDDDATTRAKIAAMVGTVSTDDREAAWLQSAFLALLGIETGTSDELFGAWRTFFERLSATGPVVLVFEDLHWADSGTLDFIDHLLEWSRNVPIYIVTLARPELLDRRPGWGVGRRNFSNLALDPLPEAAVREILAGLVPGLPEPTLRTIVDRAEGIPLYAIETIRMLVDDGRLAAGPDGVYQVTGDVAELAVPPTLTALIAARLDALDANDRALVLDAAVIGQTFTPAALAAVSSVSDSTLEARLLGLVRSELLIRVDDRLSPERGQYGFVQALVREVAYNTLSKKDRKVRHLAAARFFESLGTDEIAGALAGHYLAAHRLATEGAEQEALANQARLALRGAAERAASLGAHEQAVTFFNEAMSVVTDPAEAAELLERAGEEASIAAKPVDAELYLREAVRMHRESGDRAGLARAGARLGRALLNVYHTEAALEILTEIAAETADLRDTPPRVAIDVMLARVHWLRDEPQAALDVTDRVLGVAEQLDLLPAVIEAMILRGGALSDMGRTYEGMAAMEGGIRLADRHGVAASVALRGRNSLGAYLLPREPAAGLAMLESGIAESRRIGDRAMVLRMLTNASGARIEVGDWGTAVRDMQELLGGDLSREDRLFSLSGLIQPLAWTGEPFEAYIRELDELLEGERDGNVLNVGVGMRAAVSFAQGRYADAREAAVEAARLSPFNAPSALSIAAHAATWARDPDGVADVLAAHVATAAHGGVIDLRRVGMRAALAGLEGRHDESLHGFRSSIDGLRGLGAQLEEALTAVDMLASLSPEEADATLVQSARQWFEERGAKPFLARLDELSSVTTDRIRGDAPTGAARQPA